MAASSIENRRSVPFGVFPFYNFFYCFTADERIVNILNIKIGSPKVGKSGNVDVDINCTAMTFAAVEKKVEASQTVKKAQ